MERCHLGAGEGRGDRCHGQAVGPPDRFGGIDHTAAAERHHRPPLHPAPRHGGGVGHGPGLNVQHHRRCAHDLRRGPGGALGRQQRKALEPAALDQARRVRQRTCAEPDQALAVDPGEVVAAYGRAAFRLASAASAGAAASAFESARRYARPDASSVSVETLWPDTSRPPCSTSTDTSPSASVSAVTAATWYSFKTPEIPVAALIACKSASTAPSPEPSPETVSPLGVVTF